jgi:tetratricopeptide (TPR) repeat protein
MKRLFFLLAVVMAMVLFLFVAGCERLSSKSTAELLNEGVKLAADGKWNKAHKYAEAAVKRESNNQYTQLFFAFTCEHTGKNAQALAAAESAAELAPGNFTVKYTLGRLYAQQGKTQDAVKPLMEAFNLKPTDPFNILLLAEVYRRMNASSLAINYYNQLVRNHAEFMSDKNNAAWVWNQLAVIYTGLDSIRNAASCFRQAYTLAPEKPYVVINFAVFMDRIQRRDRAVTFYQKYLELTANDVKFAEKHELIRKRLGTPVSH